MDQKWVPWTEHVLEETSLIMEYDILQKLVLNSYLFWKKKTKQSHIMRPTKVNSWIKELNGKSKHFYFIFLQYRKIRESP